MDLNEIISDDSIERALDSSDEYSPDDGEYEDLIGVVRAMITKVGDDFDGVDVKRPVVEVGDDCVVQVRDESEIAMVKGDDLRGNNAYDIAITAWRFATMSIVGTFTNDDGYVLAIPVGTSGVDDVVNGLQREFDASTHEAWCVYGAILRGHTMTDWSEQKGDKEPSSVQKAIKRAEEKVPWLSDVRDM